jgi:hypothetical protein
MREHHGREEQGEVVGEKVIAFGQRIEDQRHATEGDAHQQQDRPSHQELGAVADAQPSITNKMALTVNKDLNAAHSISANTTSSSRTGAFRMPSQVFCTCMREKAEYKASKVAAFMALMQMEPLAKKRM